MGLWWPEKSSCNTELTCDWNQYWLSGQVSSNTKATTSTVFTRSRRFALTQIGVAKCKRIFCIPMVYFHGFVASQTRRSKTRSSHEEVPWHWILWHISLLGNSCLQTQTERWLLEQHQTSLLELISLGPNYWRSFSLRSYTSPSLHHPFTHHHYQHHFVQTGDNKQSSFAVDRQRLMNRAGWYELLPPSVCPSVRVL